MYDIIFNIFKMGVKNMDTITYAEFKKFFQANPAYVKVFDKFGQDKYKVSTMNANNFNEDMQKLFIAFFTLVDPQNIYKGRVDFIQKWYKAKKGRAQHLLSLYGSNSIIYAIKEDTLRDETWYRLIDCINKVTICEWQLNYLFDPIVPETPVSASKNEFIEYFTSGNGKGHKKDFNDFIDMPGYTESVINGTRNYSQGIHLEFIRYTGRNIEINIIDEIGKYMTKNRDRKMELCSLLYKQLYNKSSITGFKTLCDNAPLLNKSNRLRMMKVINESKKIYP